jgi:hypothetical protein
VIPQTLQLFSPVWFEPVNTSTQVDRMPGSDAPCFCKREKCEWPFCGWWRQP